MRVSPIAHRASVRPVVWLGLLALSTSGGPLAAQESFLFRDHAYLASEPAWMVHATVPPESAAADSSPPTRPGFVDRIAAVAQGRTQLEGGYAFVYDDAAGVRTTQHAVPDLLLRFGLTERLEARLGWPGYIATEYGGPGVSDTTDEVLEPNVGLMLDLWAQEGILPQTAVLAAVPITLEGNPFALAGLQPLSQWLYRWDLTGRLALGGTSGLALFEVGGDHFIQLQQTANLDYVLTDRLGTFVEWEMLVDHGSALDGPQHMLGGGLWCLLTERLQVGWRAGLGLNRRAPDFLTDVRFAYRF